MSKIKGVMMASEAIEPSGFISQYQFDGNAYLADSLAVDSNDDIYIHTSGTGTVGGTNESGQLFAKIDGDPTSANLGLVTDYKMIKMTPGNGSVNDFCISGNYIHAGQLNYVNTAASTRNYVTHFRTDLNFNNLTTYNSYSFRELSTWGTSNSTFAKLKPDYSNGVYLGVMLDQGSTWDVIGSGVIKVNSSGNQQWKKFIVGTSDGQYRARNLSDISTNANGYSAWTISADGNGTGSNDCGIISLFDSSGNQQWVRFLKNGNYFHIRGVHIDNSQNIYIAADNGPNSGYGYQRPVIVKMNSSGTVQWVKKLNLTLPSSTTSAGWVAHVYSKNIAVHGNDIYVSIRYAESDPRNNIWSLDNRCGLMKLDTSGNFGWYREITHASTDTSVVLPNQTYDNSIACDSQGNLLFGFRNQNGGSKNIVMKIPQSKAQSGAFTGTYFGEIQINALTASFVNNPITNDFWPVSSTSSPYVLTGSNASLNTVSPTITTQSTSYLY